MDFEWDPEKARRNFQKHGIAFTEAVSVFNDRLAAYQPEPRHPERGIVIGHSLDQRLLYVVHIEVVEDRLIRISHLRFSPPERLSSMNECEWFCERCPYRYNTVQAQCACGGPLLSLDELRARSAKLRIVEERVSKRIREVHAEQNGPRGHMIEVIDDVEKCLGDLFP